MKSYFRITGWLEGLSLLILLFIAMPLKYFYGQPEFVRVVGSVHGFLFLIYILVATQLAMKEKWPWKKLLLAYILSSVPFGTFYFDRKHLS